jgi:hypothetical protein
VNIGECDDLGNYDVVERAVSRCPLWKERGGCDCESRVEERLRCEVSELKLCLPSLEA